MNYEHLFTPIQIGGVTLKNRFVMPPMGSNTSDTNHRFTDQSYCYYAERAKGGFGLILTGYMCVSEDGFAYPGQVQICNDSCLPDMEKFTRLIHDNGSKCFAQLHHAGCTNNVEASGGVKVGASSMPYLYSSQEVHELTVDEIHRLTQKFVDAALRAKKAGFDGVEVHGAHGYLVHQFLSKYTNKRTDAYGGGPAGRAKFACEIVSAIRAAVGKDYPISVRMNACDDVEGGNTVEDACAQAVLLEQAGADVLDVSRGILSSRTIIASNYVQEGWNVENTRKIKACVNIPVICVGRINDPADAESILRSGAADFIALGRQSICDPHFPEKVQAGRTEEIFYCTGCLQRCQGAPCEEGDRGVSCLLNPFSGKEYKWQIEKTLTPQHVVVVGAGVAGLEAAWILAARGHKVTVLEKNAKAGGQICYASVPPMKYSFARIPATYEALGRKYGVEYRYNTEATSDTLSELKPDIILLSTGALPVHPRIPGIDQDYICQANDVLSGKKIIARQKVLVVGAGLVGCETADYLLQYDNQITIVDMVKEMATQLHPSARKLLLKNLKNGSVDFVAEAKVASFTSNGIFYEKNGQTAELSGFDTVVLAMGSRANASLKDSAETICNKVYLLGDASKSGDAKKAIYEAAKLAITL